MSSLLTWLAPHLTAGNGAPAQRFQTGDEWVSRTYGQLYDVVERTAFHLQEIGAGPGRGVAILARTRPEWSVADLAAASIGAEVVPIYPTASAAQVDEILARTSPAVLVTDREDIVPHAVVVARLGAENGALGDLDRGPLTAEQRSQVERARAAVSPEGTYTIVFSSGSTGAPKGCVLTHANYVAVLRMAAERETSGTERAAHRTRAFVYLPLAHVSARLQQLTTFTLGGELIYGAGSTDELLRQIARTRPTYVPGVPRLFESAYTRAGRDPVRLREMFGDSLSYALTGGAPIDPEMLASYEAAGIALVEGYGLTETCAALTLCTPQSNRRGSVGRALPGVDLRTAPDGEILARGANVFAGYLGDPVGTREVLSSGWLATGDLGRIDDDGFVYITGRKKNILVTSTGKNIAPEPIENRIRAMFAVDDVAVVGDRRPFLTALLFTEASALDDVALVEGFRTMNREVSPPERVRKVAFVPRELTAAAGEITPSGKMIRSAVIAQNDLVIEDLYAGRRSPGIHVIDVEGPQAAATGT